MNYFHIDEITSEKNGERRHMEFKSSANLEGLSDREIAAVIVAFLEQAGIDITEVFHVWALSNMSGTAKNYCPMGQEDNWA